MGVLTIMPTTPESRLNRLLRWSERYTHTDMVYLVRSGLWLNLGSITVSLFSLGLYVLFARVLSPETYGTYQYLLSAGALIGAFSLTGMNTAVIRAVALGFDGMLRESVRVQLRFNSIPFLISLLTALYYWQHGNTLLAWGFVLTAVLMPLNNTLNTYSAFLAGKKDFRRIFLYSFSVNLLFYTSLGCVALAYPGALALIAANLLAQTTGLFLAYRATLQTYQPKELLDHETIPYGKHLSLMGIIATLAEYADNVLAFHFLGPVALATYSFATAVPARAGGLLKFIPTALLPQLSAKNASEIRSAVSWRKIAWVIVLTGVGVIVYILAAPLLFALLFPRYSAAVPYSQVYALTIFAILENIFSTGIMAQRRIKALYVYRVVAPIVQLSFLCIGIIFFGLWGLVAAKIAGSLLLIVFSAALLFRNKAL